MSNLFVPENLPDDFFEDKMVSNSGSQVEKELHELEVAVQEIKKEQERRKLVVEPGD